MDLQLLKMKAYLLASRTYQKLNEWRYVEDKKELKKLALKLKCEFTNEGVWRIISSEIKTAHEKVDRIQGVGETWGEKKADCDQYALTSYFVFGDKIDDYEFWGLLCGTNFKHGHYVAVWKKGDRYILVSNGGYYENVSWETVLVRVNYKYLFRVSGDLKKVRRLK